MFLSPKYEVVRFKKTNIFLNRMHVKPRIEEMNYNVCVAKHKDEEEAVFMKDRSVFKDYREDTNAYLKECFEEDLWFGKIHKVYRKDPTEFLAVKECLFAHLTKLYNIFNYYCGTSDYPVISMMDVTSFAHATNLLDPAYCRLAELDLIFISTNVTHHSYLKSEERNL